jgi:hypothetical protein
MGRFRIGADYRRAAFARRVPEATFPLRLLSSLKRLYLMR